jgi:fucose permease
MLMMNYRFISWIFIIIGVVLILIAAINLVSPANYEQPINKSKVKRQKGKGLVIYNG